jgi:peptidyl-prolyl cis-trans isomerase A (cyclophilin A)
MIDPTSSIDVNGHPRPRSPATHNVRRRTGSRLAARALGAAGLILMHAAAPLNGQERVRGRVVDEGGIQPVAGAVVLLLQPDGLRAHGAIADAGGNFSVRAPEPGPYRLRAEMIGRQSVEVAIVAGDTATFHTIALPVAPIELAGLDVGAARRCSVRGEAARATHVVWEEVQKALRAESITREQALYRFATARYERALERRGDDIRRERASYAMRVQADAFETLPPDVLARDGYVRDEGGQVFVYGPTTESLLSEGFQETHCFALRRDGARKGQIGLVFEPVRGRRVADIEGVLWLDEASAELRALEFRYRNVPRSLVRGDYTGAASFRRLPAGGWIIDEWSIRSPGEGEILEVVGRVLEATPLVGYDLPVVRIRTGLGDIDVEVDSVRAPATAANFLRLVDDGAYDDGRFYRTVGAENQPSDAVKIAVVQGGARRDPERRVPPIRLEPTIQTGLSHTDGTLSMARNDADTATTEFFITIGDQPSLDHGGARHPDGQGFGAFGRVTAGMDIVRLIHAAPADGQRLDPVIRILDVRRIR